VRLLKLPALLAPSALFVLALPMLAGAGCVDSGTEDEAALSAVPSDPSRALCTVAAPGDMRCHARVRVSTSGATLFSASTPLGITAPELQSAYAIPTAGGAGVTIAVVDAYDDPTAESDLAVYRAQFGLPPCTTANGCFRKVSQTGLATGLPPSASSWAGEISLDLDMVSAACPKCKILLVEAQSAALSDLATALQAAVKLGATVVSDSYGGGESGVAPNVDAAYFGNPGVAITFSTGDSGYGVEYPASSPNVIAVGGTSLVASGSARGWAEKAWSGGGSGCSAYYAKPSYQKDVGCPRRTVADVSAVADPSTGVAVYDTFGGAAVGATGWLVFGGTSVASPLVAGILAASGHAGQSKATWLYAHAGDLYDITTGSDGTCASGTAYLCSAGAGYDGPTGLGSLDGAALAGMSSVSSSTSGSSSGVWGTFPTTSSSTGGSSSSSTSSSSSGSASTSSSSTSSSSSSTSTSTSSSSGQGASSSSSSSSGSSTSSSSSSGASTCGHAICVAGAPLVPTCDPCATKICNADAYCCNGEWDRVCVGEVGWICGETCE
jgi:hypothetical protein